MTVNHTAQAKYSGGYFDKVKEYSNSNKNNPRAKQASAITEYVKGGNMEKLVNSLSQNKDLSLDLIGEGLEKAGLPPKSVQSISAAIAKTRQRTGTRPARKAEDRTGDFLSSLMDKPTGFTGAAVAPENAYGAVKRAIEQQLAQAANIPTEEEGVA